MKINPYRKIKQQGNALIVTLVICSLLSLVMSYYLALVEQQNLLSFRSQAWNGAIVVTEAGVEDGLEQLNVNTGNLASEGWALSADGTYYYRSYTFPNGNGYLSKIIPQPSDIFNPFYVSAQATVNPVGVSSFLAAIGVNDNSAPTKFVARAVLVKCARGNLLIKGMVAKEEIDMHGNNILTDSFDSTDPSWSTLSHYDPTKTKANGDVATNAKIKNSINSGNANIYGHVVTGPGGTVAVGSQGGVGDQAWVASHPGGIQSGYVTDNANFTFPETALPYNSGLSLSNSMDITVTNYVQSSNAIVSSVYPNPPPFGGVITNVSYSSGNTKPNPAPSGLATNCGSALVKVKNFPPAGTYCGTPTQGGGNDDNWWFYFPLVSYTWPVYTYSYNLYSTNFTAVTTHYDNVLYTGDYYISSPLSGKTLVLGNARLVAAAGINMTGNDVLQIAQMASLTMYVDGSSSTLGGKGIMNENGYAINCQIYCTQNVESFTFNGNGETVAVIVAPDAAVTMNGGGHSYNDFMGALMAKTITMNGHYKFHYDEALNKNPAKGRYIVTTWDEINPTN